MKMFFASFALIMSLSALAMENCDPSSAKTHLKEAKKITTELKKAPTLEVAKVAATAIQSKMCEAATSCQKIAFDLYYPCQQEIILSEGDQKPAARYLKSLINKGLQAL